MTAALRRENPAHSFFSASQFIRKSLFLPPKAQVDNAPLTVGSKREHFSSCGPGVHYEFPRLVIFFKEYWSFTDLLKLHIIEIRVPLLYFLYVFNAGLTNL